MRRFFRFLWHVVAETQATPGGALPLRSRAGMLAVLAAFLPYYGGANGFSDGLTRMPAPHTLAPPPRGAPHAGGADLVLREAADMLSLMKSETALLTCLASLRGAAGARALAAAPAAARLRLQSSLYALTVPGGPRYCPSPCGLPPLTRWTLSFHAAPCCGGAWPSRRACGRGQRRGPESRPTRRPPPWTRGPRCGVGGAVAESAGCRAVRGGEGGGGGGAEAAVAAEW